ncbi:hypothetical protein BDF14DRAFT_1502881 [Spinellus fusiger]|nr:hypothetical protein BDF14DRAFT_1502881 [Spinellus fusiger]
MAHPKPTPDTSMANTPITTTSDSGNPVTISETNTSPVVEIKSHTLEHTTQPASVIDMTADDKEWEKFVKTRVSDKAEQVSAISTPSDWHSYSDRLQKMTEDSSSKMKLLSTQKSNRTTMNTVEVYDYQKEAHLQAHWGTEEHTTEEAYTVWGGPTEGGRGHVRHNEKGWRESTERQVPLGPGRSKYFEGGRNKSIDKGWTEPNDGRRSRPIEGRPTDPQTEEKAEETLKEQLWSEQTEPVHDEKSEEGWGAPSTSDASVKPEEDWKERIEMQEGWPTTTDPQKPIGWGKDKNFERGHSHGQGRGRGAERGAERGADRGTRRGAGTSAGAPHEGSKRPEYTAQETRSSGSWRKRPAKEEQGPSDIAPSLTVKTQPSSYSSASPDSPVTSVPKTPKPQASSRPPIFPESIRRLNGKKPASLSFMVTTDESDYDITMMDALAHTPMGTLPSHTSTVSEKDQETSCSKESSHGVDELTETLEQPKAEINKYTQRSLPNTHSHNSHHSHNHNYNHNSHSYSQSHSYNSTTPTTPTSHNIAPPIMIPHTSSHPVFVYPLPRFAPREQQDQRPMSNRPHPSHGYSNNHQHRPMNIYMMPPQQPMPYTQQGYPWPHRGVRHNK